MRIAKIATGIMNHACVCVCVRYVWVCACVGVRVCVLSYLEWPWLFFMCDPHDQYTNKHKAIE